LDLVANQVDNKYNINSQQILSGETSS